ncbi:hypothetical protein LTR17_011408 [Elasticomyces elasticus]|nr:hypothetical protein LTR17_011408 [Elasticomyces elasticus]
MKVSFIGAALALSFGLVTAFPKLVARTDDPCYCVDYVNDDNGKKYGGGTDLCWTTAYENDNCGYQYGGGTFKKAYKKTQVQEELGKWQDEDENYSYAIVHHHQDQLNSIFHEQAHIHLFVDAIEQFEHEDQLVFVLHQQH